MDLVIGNQVEVHLFGEELSRNFTSVFDRTLFSDSGYLYSRSLIKRGSYLFVNH